MRSTRLFPVIAAMAALTSGAARAETVTVTIEKLSFTPMEISVKKGDTIEWINKDAFTHSATVKDGWDVTIPPKKSAKHVVEDVGTVDYFCRFHPNMKGRITVTAP